MRGMGEEPPRGDAADTNRGTTANDTGSGWVTTQVAAKSLGVSPRTIRWHIEHDNLEAKAQGEGVRRSWLVSIDSLQAFRDTRQRARELPGDSRTAGGDADIAPESHGNAIRELAEKLIEQAERAAEFRVRLELSERAESTLREDLEKERRRREEAERESEELRKRLTEILEAPQGEPITIDQGHEEPIYQPRESPVREAGAGPKESPTPAPEGPHATTQSPQRLTLRGLGRRIFGQRS